jgi:hypothetical protein
LPLCYLCFLLFKFLCLLLSADREAASGRSRCDTYHQTLQIKPEFLEGPSRNASPLPFVTFASFCSNFFAYFCPPTLKQLWGDHPATPAVQRHTIKRGICRRTIEECRSLPLCYLCFLLFKFLCLLLSADPEAALGRPPCDTCVKRSRSNRSFSKDHRGMPVPCPFVTFASFCSNSFAYFCPPLKTICFEEICTTAFSRKVVGG